MHKIFYSLNFFSVWSSQADEKMLIKSKVVEICIQKKINSISIIDKTETDYFEEKI